MATVKLIYGIILGVIAYIVLYLGKGIQKYAIEGFKGKERVGKNSAIWIFGTILTSIFFFLHQAPFFLEVDMKLIAPLEGIGLIVLLIFSYYVLKEKITKISAAGAVLIMMAIFIILFFN